MASATVRGWMSCDVVSDRATPMELREAADFTIIDDLLHGYGGGYLAPILGSASRPAGPVRRPG